MWNTILSFCTTDRIIAISVLIGITMWGFIKIKSACRKFQEKSTFHAEFSDKWDVIQPWLIKNLSDQINDEFERVNAAYTWLLMNKTKIQRELEFGEIVDSIQQMMFWKLQKDAAFREEYYLDDIHKNTMKIGEHLVIYAGDLDDKWKMRIKELDSPLKWFQMGLRNLFALPLELLSFGVLTPNRISNITSHYVGRYFQKLLSFLLFMATVMTIILGWNETIEIVLGWMPWTLSKS